MAKAAELLITKGFTRLSEKAEKWNIAAGGKYFLTRDGSGLFAFVVGSNVGKQSVPGFVMIGSHTDSPCLRVRPRYKQNLEGLEQVGVVTYGGGLWHTWFDRGLGFAGKVVVRNDEGLTEMLIRVNRPVMFIPNLAIHLQTPDERTAFKISKEDHLQPIIGLLGDAPDTLTDIICSELKVSTENIVDFDLCLFDATPAQLAGYREEFVLGGRLDNLMSMWASVEALTEESEELGGKGEDIYVACAFDHEECGSRSAVGADSVVLGSWLRRIAEALEKATEGQMQAMIAKSVLVSADGAHLIHPNYASKHQKNHKVKAGQGVVFKLNANQSYATTCRTASIMKEICKTRDIPVQTFIVRNDSPCGSTIGPLLSAKMGIRTIDLGAGQWAMHSCLESCSSEDVLSLHRLCRETFRCFREVDSSFMALDEAACEVDPSFVVLGQL